MSPVFIYNFIRGELVRQAERKEGPSTHIPDLDNANVGNSRASREASRSEASRIFSGGADMVKVNGMELELAGKTLSAYLATTAYDPKRIAVERNGDIVFKSQYDSTVLEDGDRLEIVSFVGGG